MGLIKYLLALVMAFGCTSIAHGLTAKNASQDSSRYDEELNERDWEALRDFVNTKRTIDVKEKATNLTISGDVRTEYRHLYESLNHYRLRGGKGNTLGRPGARPDDIVFFNQQFGETPQLIKEYGAPLPISQNDFDMEFNLYFDYRADKTWAVAQLQFDNSAGVDSGENAPNVDPEGWFGSGKCAEICLKKAYFGYNVFCCDGTRFDVELGRRRLYTAFDSKVQFLSRFDGILLKYSTNLECISDMYAQLAGFVVDERVNQFAWATEFGFKNIYDTGIDFKYSFIDWQKYGFNRTMQYVGDVDQWKQTVNHPLGFRYMVSQWLLCYHLDPELLNQPAKIYAAFLMNHARKNFTPIMEIAPGVNTGKPIRCNLAWYAGLYIGDVVKEGDWAFDFQYQVVEALAVPGEDCGGIGNGNCLDNSITGLFGRGNTNYQGFRLEGLYALTDNITIDTIFEWSKEWDKKIGTYRYVTPDGVFGGSGRHRYSKLELEAIYAF